MPTNTYNPYDTEWSNPLTGKKRSEEEVKNRLNNFFLQQDQEPTPETSGILKRRDELLTGMSSLINRGSPTFIGQPTTPGDITKQEIKNEAVENSKKVLQADIQTIMSNPQYDDFTKASMVQEAFNQGVNKTGIKTVRSYIEVLNSEAINNSNPTGKKLAQFVQDSLREYQEHVEDVSLIKQGSKLKGMHDLLDVANPALEDFPAMLAAPMIFAPQIDKIITEVMPELAQEAAGWQQVLVGDYLEEFKSRLRNMPIEQQRDYAIKISDAISNLDYAGFDNDFIKSDMAHALLDWEDEGDIGNFLNSAFGALDVAAAIPIFGVAAAGAKRSGQTVQNVFKRLRNVVFRNGRTGEDMLIDTLAGRVKEDSAWAIANAVNPDSAKILAQQAISDPSGRIAKELGTSIENLTVETMLPKMAQSKQTPGATIIADNSWYSSIYNQQELESVAPVASKLDSDTVRLEHNTTDIYPANVRTKDITGKGVLVEYGVTRKDGAGFTTYEHAKAVADSYESQLRRLGDKDGKVDILIRSVGGNEYVPLPKNVTGDFLEGDFRVQVSKTEGLHSGYALASEINLPDKVSGNAAGFFDKNAWMEDVFNVGTNAAVDRMSGYSERLKKTIEPLTTLKLNQQKEVLKALDEGEQLEHWWTPEELKDRWGDTKDFIAKSYAYLSARQHQEQVWSLINSSIRTIMNGQGHKEIFFPKGSKVLGTNTNIDGGIKATTAIAARKESLPPDVHFLYDADLDTIRRVTPQDLDDLKESRARVYQFATKKQIRNKEIGYMLSRKSDEIFQVNELPAAVIRRIPGYLTRKYNAAYVAKLRKPIIRENGIYDQNHFVTLGIESNAADAQVMLRELKAEYRAEQIARRQELQALRTEKRMQRYSKSLDKKLLDDERRARVINRAVRKVRKDISLIREKLLSSGKLTEDEINKLADLEKQRIKTEIGKIDLRSIHNKQSYLDTRAAKYQSDFDAKTDEFMSKLDKDIEANVRLYYADEFSPVANQKAFEPGSLDFYEASGQLYTSSRRSEELLGRKTETRNTFTGELENKRRRVIAPISEVFTNARESAARAGTLDLVIDKMTKNWELMYSEKFGAFPWLNKLSPPQNLAKDDLVLHDNAVSMSNYIKRLAGLEQDAIQRFTRSQIVRVTEGILSYYPHGWESYMALETDLRSRGRAALMRGAAKGLLKTADALHKFRDTNVISKLKAIAFFQYITVKPFRQIVLQSQQLSMYMGRGDYGKYFLTGGGKEEFATVWAGLLARSLGNFDSVAGDFARAAKMTEKEYKELIDAYIKTGMPASVDSHIWVEGSNAERMGTTVRDYQDPSKLMDIMYNTRRGMNVSHKWLRRIGFDAGEQTQLLGAFLAEKRAWQVANPGKDWKADRALTQIQGRARALSGNMNKAGQLAFQSGILGSVFQFLSHSTKMAQLLAPSKFGNKFIIPQLRGKNIPLLSKIAAENISNEEKYKMMLTQLLTYGVGGLGLYEGWEAVRDKFTEETGVEVPRTFNTIVEEGLMGTAINMALLLADQQGDLEVGKSLGPISGAVGFSVRNPITHIYSLLMNSNASYLDWFGPGMTALSKFGEGFDTLFRIMGDTEYLDTPEKIGASLAALSSAFVFEMDNWQKIRYENTLESYIATNGDLQTNEDTVNRLSKILFGIRSRKSRELGDLNRSITGIYGGYKTAPDEDFNRISSYAKQDFETIKKSFQLLNEGNITPQELNRIHRIRSEIHAATMSPRELMKYKRDLRMKLYNWMEEVKPDRRTGLRKSNLENQLVTNLTRAFPKMEDDAVEDMIAQLKNHSDFPGKEKLISDFERALR